MSWRYCDRRATIALLDSGFHLAEPLDDFQPFRLVLSPDRDRSQIEIETFSVWRNSIGRQGLTRNWKLENNRSVFFFIGGSRRASVAN